MKSLQNQNILLVQLFSNGDCLYATAVARQIKTDYPGCKLTWAIAPFCKNIILDNPYIDEVMVVENVDKKNSWDVYKKVKALLKLKGSKFNEVFATQDYIGDAHANFDGYIRGRILNCYPYKITVPLQPVLKLTETEVNNANVFFNKNNLSKYKSIILFEFAPLSGQIRLSKEDAFNISKIITEKYTDTAIVLSSADKIENSSDRIIDGSALSLRETAAFTHYCNYLLGCSSGITWITSSSSAKMLPMIQLIDPDAIYLNSPANDFKKFNIKNNGIIELHNFAPLHIAGCFQSIYENGFESSFRKFNKVSKINFKTTTAIVYNLVTSFKWRSLITHWKVNVKVHGLNATFILFFAKGLFLSPFYFLKNRMRKFLKK
jgi:ADP-heptose:LPS heptosyltransferase